MTFFFFFAFQFLGGGGAGPLGPPLDTRLLNNCLSLYSLNACILNSTLPCSCIVPHIDAINSFHDHIIEFCKIAMSVHIPHTNSGVCKAKVGIMRQIVYVKNLY